MMTSTFMFMTTGFALGLLHALDADHVMAVSALSNPADAHKRPGIARVLRFSANWALGHASVLLVSGALLFGIGWHLPEFLQKAAELSVGVLLIGLGLFCFWQFRRQHLVIEHHQHHGVSHTHWHIAGDVKTHGHGNHKGRNGHAPVFVGVVHGLAGSAPALALVPAVANGELGWALVYLLIFSLGVMLSMMAFGLSLGSMQSVLQRRFPRLFQWQRHGIAAASVLFGGYWMTQALSV